MMLNAIGQFFSEFIQLLWEPVSFVAFMAMIAALVFLVFLLVRRACKWLYYMACTAIYLYAKRRKVRAVHEH